MSAGALIWIGGSALFFLAVVLGGIASHAKKPLTPGEMLAHAGFVAWVVLGVVLLWANRGPQC